MARDLFSISVSDSMLISLLKWFAQLCVIIVFIVFDAGIAHSATTAAQKKGDPGESPPDYATSRVVGAMKVGGASVVVFENAKGEQTFYRTGETFADGSKIVSVHANSIIVRLSDGSSAEYFVTPNGSGKPGAASAGRQVTASPPAYTPSPSPVTSESERGRVPRRRQRATGANVDE